jgi:hypothetical protein
VGIVPNNSLNDVLIYLTYESDLFVYFSSILTIINFESTMFHHIT